MKKILVAFDGTNFSEGAFAFARWLNTLQPVLVTGVFVPQVDFANLWSFTAGAAGATVIPMLEESDAELVQKNIEHFEQLCAKSNMACRVHKDYYGFAAPELKRESRYADLLVIGGENFYQSLGDGMEDSMRETLHLSECPVVVVPETYQFPQSVVLAYDGSESSVYAIRQFAYLFPQLVTNPTLLVYSTTGNQPIPAKENIEELAGRHFPNLELLKLDIDPRKYFNTWLGEKKGAILVCGSFGRSELSQMFRKSFMAQVIQNHQLPIFIAHK